MAFPKVQVLSLVLVCVGVLLIACAVFVVNEKSSINWFECKMDRGSQHLTWAWGLERTRIVLKEQGTVEANVAPCASELKQSFSSKPCDASNAMYGLGITALCLAAVGVLVGLLSFCMRYDWRPMTGSSAAFFLAALFVAIGAGNYRKVMGEAFPTVHLSNGDGIDCSVAVGPLALCFTGAIFCFFASVLFLPCSMCLPAGSDARPDPRRAHMSSSGAVNAHQPDGRVAPALAFTSFSSDADADFA